MYNVVFRTIIKCATEGAITWSSFETQEDFERWYDEKMRSWYEVVEQNVSEARAVELCSSPEATSAVLFSHIRELAEILSHV